MPETIYGFTTKTLQGKEIALDAYRGKVLLVVNTATGCGQSPQLESLEALYRKYKDNGLVIIGFPSDSFAQEPREGEEIAEYCSVNYGVSFPMMQKVQVRGENADPVFQFFANKKANGKIARIPKWNFYKFLIGRDGKVIDAFWTYRKPTNKKIIRAIENALK